MSTREEKTHVSVFRASLWSICYNYLAVLRPPCAVSLPAIISSFGKVEESVEKTDSPRKPGLGEEGKRASTESLGKVCGVSGGRPVR